MTCGRRGFPGRHGSRERARCCSRRPFYGRIASPAQGQGCGNSRAGYIPEPFVILSGLGSRSQDGPNRLHVHGTCRVADDPDGLRYFTHEINGRLYAGWYRRRPGGRVEVFTRTKVRTEFLGQLTIEEQARRILKELVAQDDFSAVRDDAGPVLSRRKK